MPSAVATPAPAARPGRSPRRSAVSMSRMAIGPTGIATPNPATAPASSAPIIGRPSDEDRPGQQGARDGHADAGQRAQEVVLGEPPVVELLEPGERLRGDDEPDRGLRAGQHERDDEQALEDADRLADPGRRAGGGWVHARVEA